MQASRRLPQERVQHVLPRLHERGALLALPRLPPRPQINTDKEVVVPRRDQGERDTEGAGHRRRADVHHQQRPRRLPQRAPAAEARQGRHQHLRGLRPQPPRLLPLLLPRLQDCRHRRGLQQEQPSAEQEEEQEQEGDGGSGRDVGLGAVVHEHQPRRQQRQEQCDPELHPLDPAADRRQLPRRQAAEGHPSQSSLRKPHARILSRQSDIETNQHLPLFLSSSFLCS